MVFVHLQRVDAEDVFRRHRVTQRAFGPTGESPLLFAQAARRGFEENWTESVVVPQYLDVVARAAREQGRDDIVARIEKQS